MSGELEGRTILVVEDDYLLATDLERALMRAGATVRGPFSHDREEALCVIEAGEADSALLDINLGDGPSFILARMLQERGVPFAFVTGYETVPEGWRHVPLVNKPVDLNAVVRVAKGLVG